MSKSQGIQGKVVVITGASSGLGKATARHLADHGARQVLTARRVDRLLALAQAASMCWSTTPASCRWRRWPS